MSLSIALLTAPFFMNFPTKLTYNTSASAPVGFYRITAAITLNRGVYTLVLPPPGFRVMAATRQYLPLNVPLIKRVVGLSGDMICRRGQTIFVNQKPVATALLKDHRGRNMPIWQGCFILSEDQFFALMTATDSFDGRYFGPLNTKDIIGVAVPIFTWTPEDGENLYEYKTNQDKEQKDGAKRKAR